MVYNAHMKTSEDRRRIDIANTLLDIIDREKRFVVVDDEDFSSPAEGLKMQIREVAFALIQDQPVSPDLLR
jgi:hypothetical protein